MERLVNFVKTHYKEILLVLVVLLLLRLYLNKENFTGIDSRSIFSAGLVGTDP